MLGTALYVFLSCGHFLSYGYPLVLCCPDKRLTIKTNLKSLKLTQNLFLASENFLPWTVSHPQWPVLHPCYFQWRMLSQFSFSGWWCSRVSCSSGQLCSRYTSLRGRRVGKREEVGEAPSLAGGGELLTLDAKGLVDLKEESWCLWLCHLRNSWIKLRSTFSSSADILTLS